MRRRGLGWAVALHLLLWSPRGLSEPWWGAVALSGELILLLWLRREGLKRGWRWVGTGTWLGVLGLGLWAALRAVGLETMNQEPLLYDLLFLARHVVVLMMDMAGALFWPGLVGLIGAGGLLAVGTRGLLRRSDLALVQPGGARVLGVGLLWALLCQGAGLHSFVGPGLLANLVHSAQVGAEVRALVVEAEVPSSFSPDRRPDVQLVVVESYGRLLLTQPRSRVRWLEGVLLMESALAREGWHSVSAMATAPVSGGRSWLSDATVLLGQEVAHESVYRQLKPHMREMRSLPRDFAAAGYETVLVRPKDRARPGVTLQNAMGFGHTVFFDELHFGGRPVGWGWIPDQHTLGVLEEEVLPSLSPPRFVFAHLASSHAPWEEVPKVVADWRRLDDGSGAGAAVEDRGLWEELEVQLGRYRRISGHKGHRKLRKGHMERYTDAVLYDLRVLTSYVEGLPKERPVVVVLYGDHQPPLLSKEQGFDVPVHVMSRDPALLEAFVDEGFSEGLRLREEQEARLRLSELGELVRRSVGG